MAEDVDMVKPFKYQHYGSLAYIGADSAVADFTGSVLAYGGSSSGRTTFWLWRSFCKLCNCCSLLIGVIDLSEMFTSRTRMLLAFDWLRSRLYGRDISRL